MTDVTTFNELVQNFQSGFLSIGDHITNTIEVAKGVLPRFDNVSIDGAINFCNQSYDKVTYEILHPQHIAEQGKAVWGHFKDSADAVRPVANFFSK